MEEETTTMKSIDEANFQQYFRDARRHRPQQGEVMAKFTAIAEFVGGQGKADIIHLLKIDKAFQAVQVMKKIHAAKEPDCYRICREICEDLLVMKEAEVEQKAYEFVVEYFFYTRKELVPKNKHWEVIKLLEYDKESQSFKSTIEL